MKPSGYLAFVAGLTIIMMMIFVIASQDNVVLTLAVQGTSPGIRGDVVLIEGNGIDHTQDTPNTTITTAVLLQTTATDALSSTTQSASGLEFTGGRLTLLQGCAGGDGPEWNETLDRWECGADAGAGGGYSTIQDEGVSLTARSTANFIGGNITCVDNPGATKTDCTISGGGSSNSFETIDAPAGTDPVADSATDTLQLLVTGTELSITGDSTLDTPPSSRVLPTFCLAFLIGHSRWLRRPECFRSPPGR